MKKLKTFGDMVKGKIQASQDSKDSLDKSAVKSKISGEPLDIIAHILQNVFERHHEDIKIMRKTILAQMTVIDLLKSENATQNDDTDAQFEKKSEVGLKTLDDLIVFQSFQIKCAEQSSNGMKDWLCYFIEQSGTKLPPAFTSLRKGISNKEAHTAPNIGEHVHLYSIELQKTLEKVEKDIVDIEKLFHQDHNFQNKEYIIVDSECSREFQQDASDNGIDQHLIDDLEKLKQTNRLECERIEKMWLELENNLKEFIIDSKNTKENDHSANQLPNQQSVDTQRSEDMSSLRQLKNTCRDRIQRIDDLSKDTRGSDTSQPQTEERDGVQVMGSHVHSKFPLKNTCRDRIQRIDDSNTGLRRGDLSRLQTEITDNAQFQAIGDLKSRTDDHLDKTIIKTMKEMCDIRQTTVAVMRNTISKMDELHQYIKVSQNQGRCENTSPESDDVITSCHDRMEYSFTQTNTLGNDKLTANTNITEIDVGQKDRVENNAVQPLEEFVATLRAYIKQYVEVKKHMEAAVCELGIHRTVVLQLYNNRNDDVMMNVVRSMSTIIRDKLKECEIDAIIKYCNTPEQIKPNVPALVLFINCSRLVTDSIAAIKGINLEDQSNVALVAFHYIDVNFAPLAKSALVGPLFNGIAGVHHMAFLVDKGVYDCPENAKEIQRIVSFIIRHSKL